MKCGKKCVKLREKCVKKCGIIRGKIREKSTKKVPAEAGKKQLIITLYKLPIGGRFSGVFIRVFQRTVLNA